MKVKIILFLGFFVLLSACGGSKPIKQKIEENISCQTMPATLPPEWVYVPIPRNENYLYGVGVADGFDISFQEMKKRSKSNSEADLSAVIETRISSNIRQDIQSINNSNSESVTNSVRHVIQSNSDMLLSEVYVDEVWFNKDTCQLWTKVKLSRKELEKSQRQMKSMILLEIEKTSKSVGEIKGLIEEDPNVKLRKYGLTISSFEYMRALDLGLPRKELFGVLDLYKKYGATPFEAAYKLGFGSVEPHKSFVMKYAYEQSFKPDFSSLNLVQALSALKGYEGILTSVLEYSNDMDRSDNAVKFSDSRRYDAWVENEKTKMDVESKKLAKKHKKARDEINKEYSRTKNREEYEINMEKFELITSGDWEKHRKRHDLFYKPGNQLKNRARFDDYLYTVHIAACYGSIKSIKLLEESNYSINKKTKLGYSPYEIAKYCKNKETMEYLY